MRFLYGWDPEWLTFPVNHLLLHCLSIEDGADASRLSRAFASHMQENLVQLRRLLNGHTFHVHNAPSQTHATRGEVPAVFFIAVSGPSARSTLHLRLSHHVLNHQS